MSNGSHEREHPRDVQCEHCGRFYRNDGLPQHEANCPYQAVGETIVPLPKSGGVEDTPSNTDEGGQPPQDGEGVDPDPVGVEDLKDVDDADDEPVRTDGAGVDEPADPPEPPEPVDHGDDQDEDEVPDHYKPVEEWVESIEDDRPELADDEQWRRYRDNLVDQTDYVDLEATDADRGRVVAVQEGEI